jgi:hypothetical protein
MAEDDPAVAGEMLIEGDAIADVSNEIGKCRSAAAGAYAKA